MSCLISGRLYFRNRSCQSGPTASWNSGMNAQLAVELLRQQARIVEGKHLAVFDGGYALESVVRPPGPARSRCCPGSISSPAAVRRSAVRLAPAPEQRPKGKPGPQPKWSQRLEPPRRGGMWKAKWQVGTAFVDGRQRTIRWKEIICLWRVLGWEVPVKVIVASVEGYKERLTLVTSAVELTGPQMVELFTAVVPAGGRVSRPEAAAGLGGVPGVDGNPIQRTEPGAVGDDEPAAVVAVSAGGVWKGGLVVAAAVEQEEGSSQRAGRGSG